MSPYPFPDIPTPFEGSGGEGVPSELGDRLALRRYLGSLGYPTGNDVFAPIQPKLQPTPGLRIGPVRLSGPGLDSAALSVLGMLQGMPRPQGFGQNFATGLAYGLAGGRARQAQARGEANKAAVEGAAEQTKSRQQAAREFAQGLARHRYDMEKARFTQGEITGRQEAKADISIRKKVDPETTERLKRIAKKIVSGELPPDLNQYGRDSAIRIALADEVTALGANVTEMAQQYLAEQTFLRSANGTVALRLSRNVINARESLGYAENLLDKSMALIPRGAITVFNKVSMDAAAEGLYGPEAAAMARKLRGQIAALRFELANIYMGGTAPTDQSVKKAMDMIDSDWSEAGLRGAIELAKRDLGIRVNAMKEVGPISLRGGKPHGIPNPDNLDRPDEDEKPKPAAGAANAAGKAFLDSLNARKPKR